MNDVYVTNTWQFEREVARLNKKAARIGVAAIKLVNLGKVTKTRTYVTVDEDGAGHERHVPVDCTHYQIEAPQPEDRTWETIVKITPVDGVAFVEAVVKGTDIEAWKSADPQHCDHCQTRRARNISYVVRNTADGRVMQLGRNCFEDYVGKDTLQAMEFRSVVEVNLGGDDEGFFPMGGGAGGVEIVDTRACVAAAEMLNLAEGWKRNMKNEYGDLEGEGTHRVAAACVRSAMLAHRNLHSNEATRAAKSPSPEALALAEAAIERLQGMDVPADDEFATALKNVADYSHIPAKKASLAAYIGQYLRGLDQKAAFEARKATMKHVGTVGERLKGLVLKVVRVIPRDGNYGTTYITALEDLDGNQFTWFASGTSLDVGVTYSVTGTVKSHGDFRGVPQTVLTRCKAVEATGPQPEAVVATGCRVQACMRGCVDGSAYCQKHQKAPKPSQDAPRIVLAPAPVSPEQQYVTTALQASALVLQSGNLAGGYLEYNPALWGKIYAK